VKAATFFDRKWAHLRRPGVTVVRASLGRYGDEHVLQRDDVALVTLAHLELGRILGKPLPAPLEARVQRWGGALPQYPPGHLDRVAALRAGLPATIAVAGAAYDGVGIPACIRSGMVAADSVLEGLSA
jgi:oxygen-dependent protoporphyrinogen oxidase